MLGILDVAHQLMVEYRPYSGYILVFYGLVECYIGSRIFRYLMTATGFLLTLAICSRFPTEWIEINFLRYTVFIFLGIGIGALFFFNRIVRISIKGGLVFWVLGACIMHLFNATPNNMLFIGLAVLGCLIFIISDRETRVVGLAMLGAFLSLYGCLLSWSWGTYQDMNFVFDIMNPDFRLIGLILGWTLLFSTGVIFQRKLMS